MTNFESIVPWNLKFHTGDDLPKANAEIFNLTSLHTGQCTRTGGCYNELVVAFLRTGDGLKGKKSIPLDFMIYL